MEKETVQVFQVGNKTYIRLGSSEKFGAFETSHDSLADASKWADKSFPEREVFTTV